MDAKITISDKNSDIDKDKLFSFLHNEAYWSIGIPREIFLTSLENSINFSVLLDGNFCGFARVVTDKASFVYLADVYIEKAYRGRGYSKILIEYIMNYPEFQDIRTWLLLTSTAQGLYTKFNWGYFNDPNRVMRYRSIPDDIPFYSQDRFKQ